MKRTFNLFLILLLGLMLVSCAGTDKKEEEPAVESDIAYIQEKGVLIVGITDFAPMDFQVNGEWTGFDAEVGRKIAEDLGVEIEFVEIDWDSKIFELNNKSVDCIWNGMTLTDEVMAAMETSVAYLNNAQVIVMKKEAFDAISDVSQCGDLQFAVEAGSAGEAAAKECGFNYVSVQTQADSLLEVDAGTSDAAIIDVMMAAVMTGKGSSYSDLSYGFELTKEEYGVGCRKGSDLAAYISDGFRRYYADGSLLQIAEQFEVQGALIAQ